MATLEEHYRDLCDIEFTIERGKLWMLQTRVGKRTAGAAFRIATQLVDEGLIDLDEALQPGHRRAAGPADVPHVRRDATRATLIAKGMAASPGAAVGKAVFDSAARSSAAAEGEQVILVRRETNPDDLDGMIAARGHPHQPRRQDLARRRGRPRHGQDLRLRRRGARRRRRRRAVHRATVRRRHARATSSPSTAPPARSSSARCRSSRRRSCSTSRAEPTPDAATTLLVDAVHRLHGPRRRSGAGCGVRANADTPEDAARARRFGAEGIGLCRTEHMFLGDRRELVERLILADTDDERRAALDGAAAAAARGLRRDPRGDGRRCRSRSGCSTRRCTSSCPT